MRDRHRALALGVLCCGVAHADPADDQFLHALASRGILGDPGHLISDGHGACDNYGQRGMLQYGFSFYVMGLRGQGFSPQQVDTIVGAGLTAHCPEQLAGRGGIK